MKNFVDVITNSSFINAALNTLRYGIWSILLGLLVLAGLITISPASFLGALAGGLPFYLGAGFGKNGAGDTVLAASAGFVLGLSRTLAGLTLFAFCCALFVLGKSLVLKLSHRPTRFTCPLVPFIAAGFIPAYFL